MSAMPNTLGTIVVALITALAVTAATNLLLIPRLEARKRRILETHLARDTFNSSMVTILSTCATLRELPLPPDGDPHVTAVVRERLSAERERWMQQIDDATRWMVDQRATFSKSWLTDRLRETVDTYVVVARLVMLSEREESTKLDLLLELTGPVQDMFFARWWRAPQYQQHEERFAAARARAVGEADPAGAA
jgi:hypothetical protein